MTQSPWQSYENCKTLTEKSIKIAKDKFDCVVTDSARNMDKMRDALKEDDFSLIVHGCSAHMLNLQCQDILILSNHSFPLRPGGRVN